MKALHIAALISLVALSTSALAQHGPHHGRHDRHHGQHGHYRLHNGSWVWVPAALVTGALLYELNRQQQSQPPVVIVEREPVEQRCTEWREVQDSSGRIFRERTCTK